MNVKIKLFSYIVALAYIVAILYMWVSSEISGYTYFLAGEPNRAILYTEWIFGIFAIVVISIEYFKSISESNPKVIYDPLV